MMVLLSENTIAGPGVYPLPFVIANNTGLPLLERLVITDTSIAPSAVPEPSTWLLLASGLAGLVVWRMKSESNLRVH
jgi:hypothetical protein